MAKNEEKTMVAGLLNQLAKDVRMRTPEHFREFLVEKTDEQLILIFEAMKAVGLFPALKMLCDLARTAYVGDGRNVADLGRAADTPDPEDQDIRSEPDSDPSDGARG